MVYLQNTSLVCDAGSDLKSAGDSCLHFIVYTEVEYECMMPHKFSVNIVECIWPC